MKVLGIVGSARRMGNSEILAKQVLRECRNQGAEVRLLRLDEWNFSQCKGCFGCLFKGKECQINDDLKAFAHTVLFEYDRILVSAPTYVLFPPGIVKIIIDRIGIFVQQALQNKTRAKYAAIAGIAGVEGWDYFTMPMLTMFIKVITAYQANIVDRALFHHPGPGEALLSQDTLGRAELLAKRLLQGEGPSRREDASAGVSCPVCWSNSFIIRRTEETRIECPFCRVEGKIRDDGAPEWDEASLTRHRFTEKAGREFVERWILKTREVFEKNYKTILTRKQAYKNSNISIDWERS